MKKIISICLICILVLSVSVTSFAKEKNTNNVNYSNAVKSENDVKTFLSKAEKYINKYPKATLEEINEYLKKEMEKNIKPEDEQSDVRTSSASDYLPTSQVQLNEYEEALFNSNPFYGLYSLTCGKTAMDTTWALYEDDWEYHNDNADAFRHSFWNALMTHYTSEEWAEDWANAHEEGTPNPPLETSMDLYNNSKGRDIGAIGYYNRYAYYNERDIKNNVLNAVRNGSMKRFCGNDIGEKSYLVKTNNNGES